MKRILCLEPYYGGSHKYWLDRLIQYSQHHYTAMTLPAKHWKWRMSSSASIFADKLYHDDPSQFDFILCNEFVSITRLRGELPSAWKELPIVCYFHENQILYPWSQHDKDSTYERNLHYAYHHLENLKHADVLFFNSSFHLESLFKEIPDLIKRLPSPKPRFDIEAYKKKSQVLYQGIDPDISADENVKVSSQTPLIVWNHRWDEDKNPSGFLRLIKSLMTRNFEFELALLGEVERTQYWEEFQRLCPERIKYHGKLPRNEYIKVLKESSIAPITSFHDFFGISTVEALLSGNVVFVPKRMAYNEHFHPTEYQRNCYSKDEELLEKVLNYREHFSPLSQNFCHRYFWDKIILEYDKAFEEIKKC